MPLPRLTCPDDHSHLRFRGQTLAYAQYEVGLDTDWNVLERSQPTDLSVVSEPPDDAVYCQACDAQAWHSREAITFDPTEGTVLLCDFSHGFRAPEMIEIRASIVISKRHSNRRTCVVVPLSSTESRDGRAITVPFTVAKYPFLRKDSWAKCHSPVTVARSRLYRMRDHNNRGIDTRNTMIDDADLATVRLGVARFIGAVGGGA